MSKNLFYKEQPLLTPVVLTCNDEYWLPYSLEATRGFFDRYVIYDIGSTDATQDIIQWFVESMKGQAEFYVRMFNTILDPRIQGIFRNSMIAEARSEWYMILDADEVYDPASLTRIIKETGDLDLTFEDYHALYGIVPRVEVSGGLVQAYGLNRKVPHHRIYHRTAIWKGSHPGEVALYKQDIQSERWMDQATCFHFHNAERSRMDKEVPKRLERKARGTYRPGEAEDFDLLEALPILKNPIEDFEVCPALRALQGR